MGNKEPDRNEGIPEDLLEELELSIARAKMGNSDCRHFLILGTVRPGRVVLTRIAATAAESGCLIKRFTGSIPDALDWIGAAGHEALVSKAPVVLIVDGLDGASDTDIAHMLMGLHRCNQGRFPLIMVASASARIVRRLGNARSYGDRVFTYFDLPA